VWGVAQAKCIFVTRVCLSACLSVCRRMPTQYRTDPDVTRGNGRGCPLVAHYWSDLQSVHGFRCCDNTAPNAKCQRVLVLALCLVHIVIGTCRAFNSGFPSRIITPLMGYVTIWIDVRRYQTHITDDFFLSGRQRTGALCVCNTVQLLQRSRLPFSWTMPSTAPSLTHLL